MAKSVFVVTKEEETLDSIDVFGNQNYVLGAFTSKENAEYKIEEDLEEIINSVQNSNVTIEMEIKKTYEALNIESKVVLVFEKRKEKDRVQTNTIYYFTQEVDLI